MTKSELIRALGDVPEDADICIAYKNDSDMHPINNVKKLYNKGAYLETDEIPCLEALQDMAEALLKGSLSRDDIKRLEEFIW